MSLEIIPARDPAEDEGFTSILLKPTTGRNATIYLDTNNIEWHLNNNKNYKILFIYEPQSILRIEDSVLVNYHKYDLIITYNDVVLNTCKNARLCLIPAATWIKKEIYLNIDITKKIFKISTVVGFKLMTEGHHFRQLVYYNQSLFKIKYPLVIYRSSAGRVFPEENNNPLLGDNKFPLFETFQFSLVIESCSEKNYFTEKLIDCLITKTIPIYYGCPNISDFFDTEGWIILTSTSTTERIKELETKLSLLNTDYYARHLSTVNKNYNICCEKYSGFKININSINDILHKEPGYTAQI
jgi:hypothetical protein